MKQSKTFKDISNLFYQLGWEDYKSTEDWVIAQVKIVKTSARWHKQLLEDLELILKTTSDDELKAGWDETRPDVEFGNGADLRSFLSDFLSALRSA